MIREIRDPRALEAVAVAVAREAAQLVAAAHGSAARVATKSSATDVVTQTDLDAERLIRQRLAEATPGAGVLGEEGSDDVEDARVQWVIDPLDGTVNFLYGLPVSAVSIAVAIDGAFVAGAVADVLRGEVFSASIGNGAQCDGAPIRIAPCESLAVALVLTGFSYQPSLRARQGSIVQRLLPHARDIRCFGSAALHLCWIASGRSDGYFERDIKIWDWAAGAVIAAEAGVQIELPCPENDGLVLAANPAIFDELRDLVDHRAASGGR